MSHPKSIRVLLVEDNPADHVLIQGLLDRLSGDPFEFTHVQTLADALHKLSEADFDVVLLDLGLPDSFGLETCSRVVGHSPDTPVVVLTGQDDDKLALKAMQQGAQDYLSKANLDGQLIARALRYAVERQRVGLELGRRDQTLRLIANEVPAILWTTDSNLRITSSMGAALADLGLRPNETVGLTLQEYFETDDESFSPIAAHRKVLNGEPATFETAWKGRTYHAHVVPLRQHDRVVGTIGVALDVSEERQWNAERDLARQIQQSLLPAKMPNWPGFDVAGAAYPAELAGGDWFDFLPLTDNRTGIVVGDVSGHGVGPAILTAAANFCLRTLAATSSDPAAMLSTANGLLPVERAEGNFVTVMLAAVDFAQSLLEYAGAGDCAFVLDAQGQPRCRLDSTGAPLGLNKNEDYGPTQRISLEPGEIVLLLTDGFHETVSPKKDLLGYERMFAIVHQHRDQPAADILQALNAEATQFAGSVGQRDDRTGVIVKCNGNT